jgi:hypothetical protein
MPSPRQRALIAVEACVCLRTVDRVYGGLAGEHAHERVERAATRLGLPLPPERTSAPPEPEPAP